MKEMPVSENSPLVSIVTPVYNGEKYLEECIQSLRKQTYQNWECIIINNCSTDSTPDIAHAHAAQDSRIRIVDTPELLPLIQNHNFALRQISPESKYCKMVHADDSLFPSCIDQMVLVAEAYPTVGIVGSYGLWGTKVVSDGIPHTTNFLSGRELCRRTLLNHIYCFWSPSALLIRSDFVRDRDPFYGGDYLHADVEACYEILKNSDFGFVHQVLTFIRTHDESASQTIVASFRKTILSNMDLFLRYGPAFLDKDEFEAHLEFRKNRYYTFLARSVLERREKAFWEYHKETLAQIGLPFQRTTLMKKIISEMVHKPVSTLKTVKKSFFSSRKR